jgi:hypothetical protein
MHRRADPDDPQVREFLTLLDSTDMLEQALSARLARARTIADELRMRGIDPRELAERHALVLPAELERRAV